GRAGTPDTTVGIYRCPGARGCGRTKIKQHLVESFVTEEVLDVLRDMPVETAARDVAQHTRVSALAELRALEERRRVLSRAFGAIGDEHALAEGLAVIDGRRNELHARIASVTRSSLLHVSAARIVEAWETAKLDERRWAIDLVIDRVEVFARTSERPTR